MSGLSYKFWIETDSNLTNALKDVLHAMDLELNVVLEEERAYARGEDFEVISYFIPERLTWRMEDVFGFVPKIAILFDFGKFFKFEEVGLKLAEAFFRFCQKTNSNSIFIVDGSLVILVYKDNSMWLNSLGNNFLKTLIENTIDLPFGVREMPF